MTGLGRLDRDLCGFQISNLTDHHHIGILTQKRAQSLGKGEPDAHINLRLVNPLHINFDRILRCGDIALGGIENIQPGIQGNCLATAGGPGDQNHALRTRQGIHIELLLIILIAQSLNAHLGAAGVENPQHNLFTKL